ncbi:MAG: HIT domain-containing protein, partial [Clostridia bacterium]|nr:HIT domain-containing protein [Clostridia bacterium]
MDCLFCKIINGDIPSSKVYEDDLVLAFNDIEPQAPVHILIIPKEHIASAAEINESNSGLVAHVFEVAAKIAKEKNLDGFRIV